jgi:hypothetical protein
MAELGPIIVTVSATINGSALPIEPIVFSVPLRFVEATQIADTDAAFTVNLDRTDLRKELTKSVRLLGDAVEASFADPGTVVLTCDVCDAQVTTDTSSKLRHEKDGAHSLSPRVLNLPTIAGVTANVVVDAESGKVGILPGELTVSGEAIKVGDLQLDGDKDES